MYYSPSFGLCQCLCHSQKRLVLRFFGVGVFKGSVVAMLTISDASRHSRRDFLRIGALGVGGLSLSHLLAARAASAPAPGPATGKSVIFLHMWGGPSQFETFDPKMTAPAEIRSTTGEIQTRLPGITFGSNFPRLARLADKLALVRSFVPAISDHSPGPIVSSETQGANFGSYYGRVVGVNHPTTGIPSNVVLTPHAVAADAVPLWRDGPQLRRTGPLRSVYAPFVPGTGQDMLHDMRLTISPDRLSDRRRLLAQLDDLRREADAGMLDSLDRVREQAFDLILRGVSRAFDLSQEDSRVVAAYDTAPLLNVGAIRRNLGQYHFFVDHGRTIGKLLLLARRLCEGGCGIVTVCTNLVWDLHADENNASVAEGMPYVAEPFDHAVATLIEDLEARGLSHRILLVGCGEMGRTPRINALGGRDHWPELGPLFFAGGGLPMGQVIGRSDRDGGRPIAEIVRLQNMYATLMHTLFNVGEIRLMRTLESNVTRFITEGEPIRQLIR